METQTEEEILIPYIGGPSPWGTIENLDQFIEGSAAAYQVSTSSHGGIWLHPMHLERIPAAVRKNHFVYRNGGAQNWFEEDCDAFIVFVFFPELIPDGARITQEKCVEVLEGMASGKPELSARSVIARTCRHYFEAFGKDERS